MSILISNKSYSPLTGKVPNLHRLRQIVYYNKPTTWRLSFRSFSI